MTKEEKEMLIGLFKSYKFNPTFGESCNDLEIGRNQAIDWCIEEIQEFDCGKKDKLDEILEKYQMWLLDEREHIEGNKELIKTDINSDDILKAHAHIEIAKNEECRAYVLKQIVKDLESLRDN